MSIENRALFFNLHGTEQVKKTQSPMVSSQSNELDVNIIAIDNIFKNREKKPSLLTSSIYIILMQQCSTQWMVQLKNITKIFFNFLFPETSKTYQSYQASLKITRDLSFSLDEIFSKVEKELLNVTSVNGNPERVSLLIGSENESFEEGNARVDQWKEETDAAFELLAKLKNEIICILAENGASIDVVSKKTGRPFNDWIILEDYLKLKNIDMETKKKMRYCFNNLQNASRNGWTKVESLD